MELSFEDEFPENKELILSPQLQHDLYNKMKQVVVIIETRLKSKSKGKKSTRVGMDKDKIVIRGGGVFVDNEGSILTSSRFVSGNYESISFVYEDGLREEQLYVEEINKGLGLAILKPTIDGDVKFNYSKFGNEESVYVGMPVHLVSHPGGLKYTFVVGQVSFDCKTNDCVSLSPGRIVSDALVEEVDYRVCKCQRKEWDVHVLSLDKDLDLIQINNFHSLPGSFGSPVFDSRGRVVGICSFIKGQYDFAIHVTALRKFYQTWKAKEVKRVPQD